MPTAPSPSPAFGGCPCGDEAASHEEHIAVGLAEVVLTGMNAKAQPIVPQMFIVKAQRFD
ncbi:MAG: hypothetical protein ACLTGI_12125 [Hoylesella buccalis]